MPKSMSTQMSSTGHSRFSGGELPFLGVSCDCELTLAIKARITGRKPDTISPRRLAPFAFLFAMSLTFKSIFNTLVTISLWYLFASSSDQNLALNLSPTLRSNLGGRDSENGSAHEGLQMTNGNVIRVDVLFQDACICASVFGTSRDYNPRPEGSISMLRSSVFLLHYKKNPI